MPSQRKFFVGGNWKMNGNKKEIDGIINFLTAGPLDPNTGMWLVYAYDFFAARLVSRLINLLAIFLQSLQTWWLVCLLATWSMLAPNFQPLLVLLLRTATRPPRELLLVTITDDHFI